MKRLQHFNWIILITFLISCSQSDIKSVHFYTLNNSFFIGLDSLDGDSLWSGYYYLSDTSAYRGFDKFYPLKIKSKFKLKNNVFIRLSCLEDSLSFHDTIFNFNMQIGDSIEIYEHNDIIDCRAQKTKIYLRAQKQFHDDTLFYFEVNHLIFNYNSTNGYYSKFYIVSKSNGIYGECQAFIDTKDMIVRYWYLNGMFDFEGFHFYKYELKKARII